MGRFNPSSDTPVSPVPAADPSGKTKVGFGDAASAVLGATSLVAGLTRKKPKKFEPKLVNTNIRPAQADLESAQRAKRDVAESAYSAIDQAKNMAGADGNAGLRAVSSINTNTNKANAAIEAGVSEQYTKDKQRVSQELNQKEMINTQIMNQADESNTIQDQVNFNAKTMANNASVQSALNYFTAKEADMKNKAVAEKQSQQAIDAIRGGSKLRLIEALRPYYTDTNLLMQDAEMFFKDFDGMTQKKNESSNMPINSILGRLRGKNNIASNPAPAIAPESSYNSFDDFN